MSTDHVFASQMWAWPDPVIKRDSHGRIMVVNAAFLRLYGGTVESWTGNPIDGWPVPKSSGEMSRFESRIPLPTGGETVYDWLETTHQDGSTIAIARDVSAYAMTQQVQAPALTADQMQAELASLSPMAQSKPAATPVAPSEPTAEPASPPIAAAAAATAAVAAAAIATANPAPEPAPAEPIVAEAVTSPAVEQEAPQPAEQTVTPTEVEKSPVLAPLPVETPAAQPQAEDNRDFERRALPIENEEAILGNNWRDAVIAKAVGVEDSSDETVESESAQKPPMTVGQSGEQVRVLLAEDNAINALLTRTLLEAEGCSCDVVEDGALAVEAVKNNDYDLIFMDMRMPNMDGLEATRKIRAMGKNAKVLPIVALTANAFDDDRNACFDSGMNDFMTKPVSAEELSAMVATHTSLEAAIAV